MDKHHICTIPSKVLEDFEVRLLSVDEQHWQIQYSQKANFRHIQQVAQEGQQQSQCKNFHALTGHLEALLEV